jgi:hypothetical protein
MRGSLLRTPIRFKGHLERNGIFWGAAARVMEMQRWGCQAQRLDIHRTCEWGHWLLGVVLVAKADRDAAVIEMERV